MQPTGRTTSLHKETPPLYDAKDGNLIVNYNITLPEWLYLVWQQPCIRASLQQKCGLIFLGASEKMQESFNTVVKTTAKDHKFTQKETNLNHIVASICSKTKAVVLDILTIELRTAELADEKMRIITADRECAKFNSLGHAGSMCTLRQASHMLQYSELSLAHMKKEMASCPPKGQ